MVQSSHNEVVLFHSLDLPDPAATPSQVWEICSNHTLKRCLNSEVWRRELSPLIELIFSGWVNVDEEKSARWRSGDETRPPRRESVANERAPLGFIPAAGLSSSNKQLRVYGGISI